MPKVSVIVPTHNRALSLCRAVDSVLNQSFRDLEVLIIDDASTDHTADFAADCGSDFPAHRQLENDRPICSGDRQRRLSQRFGKAFQPRE